MADASDYTKIKFGKHLRFTSNVLRSIGIVNDAGFLFIAYILSIFIYNYVTDLYLFQKFNETAAIILVTNYFLIRISRDSYSSFKGQAEDVGRGAAVDFILAASLTIFMIILFDVSNHASVIFSTIYISLSIVLLYVSRFAFRKIAYRLMTMGYIGQRVVIYATDHIMAERVIELLALERLPHLKVIGFADERKTRLDQSPIGTVGFVGGFPELLTMAQAGRLDQVIIALPRVSQKRLDAIITELSAAAIDVCCLPREMLELKASYRISFIGSLPVFSLWQRPIRDLDVIAKGLQDRIIALIALILASPILILTALAIRLESKGDILFVQTRFGFNNLEISIFKFRSMYVDRQDVSGEERTKKDDARVTRVGRFIRRWSIDELPQLFNVLRGEMSLVGPRPHATQMRVGDKYYFDAVEGYAARHRVKPGITGLAQVRGLRGEIATIERAKKRVEYDTYYIEHWSPLLDVRIIVETMLMIIWDRNAY